MIAPAVALLIATLGFTAASSGPALGSLPTGRTWIVQVGAQTPDGAIQTMNYGPGTIWIDKGDTVRWLAKSDEIHTVSFINASHPDSGYNPSIAYMNTRTTHTWIGLPGQFRNSGIMDLHSDGPGPQYRTYSLKFTGVGTFHYICYVHGGMMMHGTVIVRQPGTAYPHTQGWYNSRQVWINNALIAHGLNLWSAAMDTATSHHVYVGAADMSVMVMRYIAPNVTINKGESVTFDMAKNTVPVPHTVTFGPEPQAPVPVGDPTAWDGTGTLSSGIILPPGFGPPGSSTYTVTFTKAGTYHYICMLHDTMGMVGTVTVQ
ncbi:MAG: cupredoxin domain-containing protein [Marmoricola sp.]